MNSIKCYPVLALLFLLATYPLQAQDDRGKEQLSASFDEQLTVFPQEKIYAHIDKYFYMPDDTLWFALYLVDAATHLPLDSEQAIYVELIDNSGEVADRVKIVPDENYQYYGYIPLLQDYGAGNFLIRAYAPYMVSSDEDYFFKRNIFVAGVPQEVTANAGLEYEVGFFPEGGELLSGTPCYVAFKAINEKGLGEAVSGEIVDNEGNIITTFESNHLGMGMFNLTAEQGKSYSARCFSQGREEKVFSLPKAVDNRYALHTRWMNNRLIISVKHAAGMTAPDDNLQLLLHSRGVVQDIITWDHSKEFVAFPKALFPAGILQAVLLDKQGNILSERLLFCMNEMDMATVGVSANKATYSPREQVMSYVTLTDREGKPLKGRFSVSVTDDNSTYIDTTLTIASSLLLSSEIKGYIENPGYYFQEGNRQAAIDLDYLMMTQGWKRYDIAAIAKGDIKHPYVDWDGGQFVSGTILGGYNTSPIEGIAVEASSSAGNYFAVVESGQDGRFSIELPHIPENNSILLTARTSSKASYLSIETDSTVFPAVAIIPPVTPIRNIRMEDDDIRTINLGEINVKARRRRKDPPKSFFTHMADYSIQQEDLDNMPVLSWSRIIQNIPNARIARDSNRRTFVIYRNSSNLLGGGGPATVMLDDVLMPHLTLDDIALEDVAQVDVIRGAKASAFGSDALGGVISITTKTALGVSRRDNAVVTKAVFPLGFQEPVEFYSPQYTVGSDASEKDLRRTIYWKPNLNTDESGKASFSFFSADTPSTYTVIIEGIDSEGKIIRSVSAINCNK